MARKIEAPLDLGGDRVGPASIDLVAFTGPTRDGSFSATASALSASTWSRNPQLLSISSVITLPPLAISRVKALIPLATMLSDEGALPRWPGDRPVGRQLTADSNRFWTVKASMSTDRPGLRRSKLRIVVDLVTLGHDQEQVHLARLGRATAPGRRPARP